MSEMSSSEVQLDNNYHRFLAEEDLDPINDDIELNEDIVNEDIAEEDITDLINMIEDNTDFDRLSLQLFGFTPEDGK